LEKEDQHAIASGNQCNAPEVICHHGFPITYRCTFAGQSTKAKTHREIKLSTGIKERRDHHPENPAFLTIFQHG
jgi:hypothetical protein